MQSPEPGALGTRNFQSELDQLIDSPAYQEGLQLKVFDDTYMNGIESSFQDFANQMVEVQKLEHNPQILPLENLPKVASAILDSIRGVKFSAQNVLDELKGIKGQSTQECQEDKDKIEKVKDALRVLSEKLTESTRTNADIVGEGMTANLGTSMRAESVYRNSQNAMISLNDSLVKLVHFKEVPALDDNDVVQTICKEIIKLISTLVSDLGKLEIVRAFVGNTQMTDACKFRTVVQKLVKPDVIQEPLPNVSTLPIVPTTSRAENTALSLVSFLI